MEMTLNLRAAATASALLIAISDGGPALGQKSGGILKSYSIDSPASLSIHEEVTIYALRPVMGVFNNLVMYDQHVKQNSLKSIVPDLATGWSWSEDGTELTFKLHEGVKWHDGQPFTARDVKCTWELLQGKTSEKLRINPRKAWYRNLEEVTTNGDFEATFRLKRPQPAFIALLASGFSPVYPCHVSPRDMRLKPIGTGPFKLVEFKPNESIKLARNADYWKPGRPYLDGLEYTIIRNVSTAILTFVSGKLDITFGGLSVPLTRDAQNQAPQAVCELNPTNVSRNLVINRDVAPFDKPELRRAMALSLDRQAFLDILTEGKGKVGGVMQPPPEGVWGMPPDVLHTLPGYEPDVAQNRKEAREIMQKLGYGPDKHLAIKVTTRDLPFFRDTAVIFIDQLKQIYIDGELDAVDTTQWFPRLYRKDFTVALNFTGNGIDDPDQNFYENYTCGAEGNYIKYCDPELDQMVERQSMEADQEKRKALVWQIERKLAEEGVRPVIMYFLGGNCRQPYVKGLTIMSNSIYNGWRMEDVWLDK
jgi:peptide/nickel transport system substrate-binding protein